MFKIPEIIAPFICPGYNVTTSFRFMVSVGRNQAMLCAIEIGLFAFGIYALASGKLPITRRHVVEGTPARVMGIIGILPLPICFGFGVLYGMMLGAQGRQLDFNSPERWILTLVEAGVSLTAFIIILVLGLTLGGPPTKRRKRKRHYDYDYEDDYDDDYGDDYYDNRRVPPYNPR